MRFLITLLFLIVTAFAKPREALIVTTPDYEDRNTSIYNIERLENLTNRLEQFKFNTTIKLNLNSAEVNSSIENFLNRLKQNRDSIGLIYYLGREIELKDRVAKTGNRANLLFLDIYSRDGAKSYKYSNNIMEFLRLESTKDGNLILYAKDRVSKNGRDKIGFLDIVGDSISSLLRMLNINVDREVLLWQKLICTNYSSVGRSVIEAKDGSGVLCLLVTTETIHLSIIS